MSSPFFATYSQVDTAYQVVIHAVGGANVDTADLTVSIAGDSATFTGAVGPANWSILANLDTGAVGMFDANFASPVAPVNAAILVTLNFVLASAETIPNGSVTVDSYTDFDGTSFGPNPALPIGSAAPCFAAGTRILTTRGEVPVEALEVGDVVMLARGGTAPVTWIGQRRMDAARHPRPWDVSPVRVSSGALARGVPHRDLVLSPDHALFLGGCLVPVRYLLNGVTIVQEAPGPVQYFHIELTGHNLLLAEGAAAESYLDTGNRSDFANDGTVIQAHADFVRRSWRADACAPLLREGIRLAVIRGALLARAQTMGWRLVHEAAVMLEADGVAIAPARQGKALCFRLPPSGSFLLRSRVAVPADVDARSDDRRTLGVAVTRIIADGRTLALDGPQMGEGWCARETQWRWTTGAARLDLGGVREVVVVLAETGLRYWTRGDAVATRAA